MVKIITKSPEETIKAGVELGKKLKNGDRVGLKGALGSGKTTFIKGILKGIGGFSSDFVKSPSFTIMNFYYAKIPVYHIDLYRLRDSSDLESTGFRDFLDENAIVIIEWCDRIKEIENYCNILIEISFFNDEREILIPTSQLAHFA